MSDLIFNLRVGPWHLQVNYRWQLRVKRSQVFGWLDWPLVQLFECRRPPRFG